MEPNLVLSIGSVFAVISMFYTMHKDAKKSAEEMTDLKVRVNYLENKSRDVDISLQDLLVMMQEIKVALVKIDTKLTSLDQEFNRNRDKQAS